MKDIPVLQKFSHIKAIALDVDGVLTDGTMLVTESGDYLRTMNVKDGFILKYAVDVNYPIAIITGGVSTGVRTRLERLGCDPIYDGVSDKIACFREWLSLINLSADKVLYIGDDIADIPVLKEVGLSCCPTDAVSEVKHVVDYISPIAGGKGVVRDVIEKILKSQGNWKDFLSM